MDVRQQTFYLFYNQLPLGSLLQDVELQHALANQQKKKYIQLYIFASQRTEWVGGKVMYCCAVQ